MSNPSAVVTVQDKPCTPWLKTKKGYKVFRPRGMKGLVRLILDPLKRHKEAAKKHQAKQE